MVNKKELYSAHITFFSDKKLLLVKFKDGVEVDLNEMNELIIHSLDLVQGSIFFLLVDARDILSDLDHEARNYFASHELYNKQNIAQAIVVNNTPIRLLANFYLKFYHHQNPVKIFNKIDLAEEWLLKQTK